MRIKNLNLVNTVTAYLFPINREKTNHSKNNALLSLELSESSHSEQRWRLLQYFCIYRLLIGCTLILIAWNFNQASFSVYRYMPFIYTVAGYILFSCLCIALTRFRFSTLDWQLFFQICGDILFFAFMLYTSGGIQSGLGGLALISLAVAGLIGRGRMALFFSSIATISLLLQEVYASITITSYSEQYTQAGLLSMAYFAVAWLAQQLAKTTIQSEKLAKERGVDLANMSQVNQLIIQELTEAILVVDEDGNIRQSNALAQTMLNIDLSDHQANFLKVSELPSELVHLISNWQKKWNVEHTEVLRITCTNTLTHVRWVPIQSTTRNGAVIFLEDMSRLEAQLQQLKLAALGRLTANIAHEIRNPLSAINHATELLQENNNVSSSDTRLMHIISDNTRRLNKIVQDILQLNRKPISNPIVINGYLFIENFLDEFCLGNRINRNIFSLNGIKNHKITFDSDHLNQILWNLCSNALRYCTQQENSIRINLSIDTQKNNTILDIIDDGAGLMFKKGNKFLSLFTLPHPKAPVLGYLLYENYAKQIMRLLNSLKILAGLTLELSATLFNNFYE